MTRRVTELKIGDQKLVVVSAPLATAHMEALSVAEREVCRLVDGGKSNAEIAELRGTQPRTIANQLRSVYKKLQVHSRRELVALLSGRPTD